MTSKFFDTPQAALPEIEHEEDELFLSQKFRYHVLCNFILKLTCHEKDKYIPKWFSGRRKGEPILSDLIETYLRRLRTMS